MRMAGRFSRRLRAWAQAKNIPVIYCSPGEDKPKIAEQPLASHEVKSGLFLVLVCKAPALVWEVQPTGTGKLGQLVPKQPWPYVNHYSFHIWDPDWGHVTKHAWASALGRADNFKRARIRRGTGSKSQSDIF